MSEAGPGWTDDRVQTLARLWGEGLSASQIAAALGGGVTRNAVIGKVHRLGLSARGRPGQASTPRPARPKVVDAKPEPRPQSTQPEAKLPAALPGSPVALDIDIPVSERVSILELRDSMCRWPLGDPTKSDFGFCGGKAVMGLPYCSHHCQIAYQPALERRRLRA